MHLGRELFACQPKLETGYLLALHCGVNNVVARQYRVEQRVCVCVCALVGLAGKTGLTTQFSYQSRKHLSTRPKLVC